MIGWRIARNRDDAVFSDIGPNKPGRLRRAAMLAAMVATSHRNIAARFAVALASAAQPMLAGPDARDRSRSEKSRWRLFLPIAAALTDI